MDINNYTIKPKKIKKKVRKIFCSNSSYLFYVFWTIRDFWFKKKGEKCRFLEIKQILEKLQTNFVSYKWNMKTIYKVVNYLIHENIIEAQIISNKLIITTVLDLKKYYIPKRILELSSLSRTLVSANYLRIYQYLKNLAISNFKSSKNANEIFESENSYAYFQNLKLDKETIIAGLKWIRKNNLLIEFENKTISKEFINHINLDKNKFFKGIKYQKELITIKLKNIEKVLYRQINQKVVSFYSKVKFIWEVQKTVIKKIKKFFEFFIKKPCYLLRKVKSGWIYSACWCKNNGIHWEINREVPKYKSFYRDKNLIIRRQGQRSFYKLFNKLKHFQNSWFFKFKIMH